jgi:hypothetical protein
MNAQIKRQLEHDQLESEMWRKSYYKERDVNNDLRSILVDILRFTDSKCIDFPEELKRRAEAATK